MAKRREYYVDFASEAEMIRECAELRGVDIEKGDAFEIIETMLTEALAEESSGIVDDITYLVLREYGLELYYHDFKYVMGKAIKDKIAFISLCKETIAEYHTIIWGDAYDCLITYNT